MSDEQKYLTDYVLAGVAALIMEKQNRTLPEALDILYNSSLYDQLSDPETGLYLQSKYYNYELLQDATL
ncbi:MAG: hypothetical protein J6U04_04725 [Salinivirgaceae bacterium]|nr:hypothetical protein [Salinivirgaceae bacterium]MBO7595093.1 hypothetical protein [Salinivirgaceae bacterium]MBR5167521.1 hypothetical protein [Salinivirgaceae bacterium]